MNSLSVTNNISYLLVFIEGVLSFFSPCIIPLIPVYMSYLAGNTEDLKSNGTITYNRRKVFIHTVFFVIGISFAFVILGMSFTALGKFFHEKQALFTKGAGILIIVLGLFQLGIFELKFLKSERKLPFNLTKYEANPLIAFLMGFTFSFAWTPCVGPALSSVLLFASSATTATKGYALILLYALGFVIPFLLLGLFTTQVLNFLKGHKKIVKYTVKLGGIILVAIGLMTFTGYMNGISNYLSTFTTAKEITSENLNASSDTEAEEDEIEDSSLNNGSDTNQSSDVQGNESNTNQSSNEKEDSSNGQTSSTNEDSNNDSSNVEEESETKAIPAFDFTLVDQYGNTHTLSDYKGKVVFLNFWATWCPPCREEMPHIEELYNSYNLNQDEVVILGVANPWSENYTNTREGTKEEVIAFLEENEYTFPVVFDETGDVYYDYMISSLPTTFMIDKEGNIFGYVPGMLTKANMLSIINQTLDSSNDAK